MKIIPNNELEAVPSASGDHWLSLGDDPQFKIFFSSVRKPVIVLYLTGDQELDPSVYINKGRGFTEENTRILKRSSKNIIVIDVGRFGTIRNLRLDPCSHPASFRFSFETFSDLRAANAAIEARLSNDMQDSTVTNLGKLPRLSLSTPKFFTRSLKVDLPLFLDAHYKLAAQTVYERPKTDQSTWLSVIVPVYNTPRQYLDDILNSFENQNITGVELLFSDDASPMAETRQWLAQVENRPNIKVVYNEVNGGIAVATNAALKIAIGRWITFLDHDDVIAPNAFKMIAKSLDENKNISFLYTDEVIIDQNRKPVSIMLKPAFDSVLLSGVNYINHFSIYRHERLRAIGYLREGFDGSQDYDLLLRYLKDLPEDNIGHLPYPAYWWRMSKGSYSQKYIDRATLAARKAIEHSFNTKQHQIEVIPALTQTLHRVMFHPGEAQKWPKISIIIPSRNGFELISRTLQSIFEKTDYPDFEVIIIDNGTIEKNTLDLYEKYKKNYRNISVFIQKEEFNFSRAVNRGIRAATGEHFLLLNNDIEVIDSSWLNEMVSCLNFNNTGIVGAKLLYPNDTIQHAGVIVGFGGLAGHWYLNHSASYGGPMNRLHVRNSVSCVTGAALLISGECAAKVGEWDEQNFAIAYNDVDYCIRARNEGYRVVWTPFACLYHHESATRGSDITGENKKRFDVEKANLQRIHNTQSFQDPTINPNYTKHKSMPTLLRPEKAPRVIFTR